ncbi:MAG: ABC transporter ATP-binding protein [Bdellovibrionales bacterium]|nr:ABC transporter ATP-binding protein [Bdellovibrionales bacterium]
MLEINEVCQSFRTGFWMKNAEVLDRITFTVPKRSIFGFLGPNGAGKTTLIHLITGIKRPVSGTLKLNGVDTHLAAAKRMIGYLPERPYFYDHLTGEALLTFFGRLTGMTESEIATRIPVVLEEVGMTHARKLVLKKYSKGMLQRIGIAQAMIHNPEFLVLDEPMSGLDPVGRKEIRELILRLAREGRTIFFSSHVIPDVESICDSVAMIRKGKLIGCGSVAQFLARERNPVEVAFAGLSAEAARGCANFTEFREMSEGFRATVGSDLDLEPALRKILDAKGKVLWVNPIRPSLEDAFS